MMNKCPICGKAHRKYPFGCIGFINSELAHVVIKKLAGGTESKEDLKIREETQNMEKYLKRFQ